MGFLGRAINHLRGCRARHRFIPGGRTLSYSRNVLINVVDVGGAFGCSDHERVHRPSSLTGEKRYTSRSYNPVRCPRRGQSSRGAICAGSPAPCTCGLFGEFIWIHQFLFPASGGLDSPHLASRLVAFDCLTRHGVYDPCLDQTSTGLNMDMLLSPSGGTDDISVYF